MISLESLASNHVQAVTQIEKGSRPSPWTYTQFESEINNSNSHPLVLLEDDIVIGYVIPWRIAGEIQIQNIVVDPAQRGRGLGELLLNVALDRGLEAGCDSAILEVRESNHPAIGLYTKYRFEIVGKREGYYSDGETALLMTLDLSQSAEEPKHYHKFVKTRAAELVKKHQMQV